MIYAVYGNQWGWHVMRVDDGRADTIVSCGPDQHLAETIRDWLTLQDRIGQLIERHGLIDVPLEDVER